MIKWRSFLSILGRIVDKCLVGHIVGIDLVLEICLRIVGTLVDERFDDFVGPDIIVRALRRIEVEVAFVEGCKGQGQSRVRVAEIDSRSGKRSLVGDGFGELDGGGGWTAGHADRRNAQR